MLQYRKIASFILCGYIEERKKENILGVAGSGTPEAPQLAAGGHEPSRKSCPAPGSTGGRTLEMALISLLAQDVSLVTSCVIFFHSLASLMSHSFPVDHTPSSETGRLGNKCPMQ